MRLRNLSYYQVAMRFIAGDEGYSHRSRHGSPRMYTDGHTLWSYGVHYPIARHEGIWHVPGRPVQIVSLTDSKYSITTNKQISDVHRRILNNSKDHKLLIVRYDLRQYATLKSGCQAIYENAPSQIIKSMLSYTRCSRQWSKTHMLYQVYWALWQMEAAEWILGKKPSLSRISPPAYPTSMIPSWDQLMFLVDYISPSIELPLDLSLKLPSLYRRVKKHCLQKVWGPTGLLPKTTCSKSASTNITDTGARAVQNGNPDDPHSTLEI